MSVHEWALLENEKIVGIATTCDSKAEVEKRYPGYEIADLYSLSSTVQQEYPYWSDRP